MTLTVSELQALYAELNSMCRVLLLLEVPNGLRRGEVFALQWKDFDWLQKNVRIHKSIWMQRVGHVKTPESERVMPLHDDVTAELLRWRSESDYIEPQHWVFASRKMGGRQPLWPEAVLRNHIRPAAARAGIDKRLTWHIFRHTFSTLLIGNGEDVKTVQSLMRHANVSMTLNRYTHAVDEKKRAAQSRVVSMIMPQRSLLS